jgi:hypothetical protein
MDQEEYSASIESFQGSEEISSEGSEIDGQTGREPKFERIEVKDGSGIDEAFQKYIENLITSVILKSSPSEPTTYQLWSYLLRKGLSIDSAADPIQRINFYIAGGGKNLGPCRAVVDKTVKFIYQCIDCSKQSNTMICADCFDNGNHKGHRVSRAKVSGVCDCGDPDMWDPAGNCCKHTGYISEDNTIPADIKERLIRYFLALLYYIIQLIEQPDLSQIFKDEAARLLLSTLNKAMDLCQDKPSIVPIFGRALRTPFEKAFGVPVQMHHRHDDYTNPKSSETRPTVELSSCTCTPLELLFRYHLKMDVERLEKCIVFFFPDYAFKQHVGVTYMKCFASLFLLDPEPAEPTFSKLFSLLYQILSPESLGPHVFKTADLDTIFETWVNLARCSVENNCEKVKILQGNRSGIFDAITNTMVEWFKSVEVLTAIGHKPQLLNKLLEVVRILQDNRVYLGEDLKFDDGLMDYYNSEDERQRSNFLNNDNLIFRFQATVRCFVWMSSTNKDEFCISMLAALIPHIRRIECHNTHGICGTITYETTLEKIFVVFLIAYICHDKSR